MIDLLLFLLGIALLVAGGDLLVRGGAAIAARFGVAPVVIGMTVVAFGTSTPELVVSLASSLRGEGAIAFGNVVGSNIANLGLLLALTALARPLSVHASIVVREIPMLVLASAVALALGADGVLSGGGPDVLGRGDGIVLLLLFGLFLYATLLDAFRQRGPDPFLAEAAVAGEARPRRGAGVAALLVLGGLALLVAGGQLAVTGATGFARTLGVPEVVIGLTMVAVGTSLPELATSLIAARRGQTDLALGNLVGSNLFNLLFVLGLSQTITPAELPPGGALDLAVMAAFALVLFPLAVTHRRRVTRLEGLLLLAGYAVYVASLAGR